MNTIDWIVVGLIILVISALLVYEVVCEGKARNVEKEKDTADAEETDNPDATNNKEETFNSNTAANAEERQTIEVFVKNPAWTSEFEQKFQKHNDEYKKANRIAKRLEEILTEVSDEDVKESIRGFIGIQKGIAEFMYAGLLGIFKACIDTNACEEEWKGIPCDVWVKLKLTEIVKADASKVSNLSETFNEEQYQLLFDEKSRNSIEGFILGYRNAIESLSPNDYRYELKPVDYSDKNCIWENIEYFSNPNVTKYIAKPADDSSKKFESCMERIKNMEKPYYGKQQFMRFEMEFEL